MIYSKKEWFGEWFDSPFYHILYKNRDYQEAQNFIDHVVKYFGFEDDDLILDLACGKGRHSIYLNEKGYHVTGIDLSIENIRFASQYANERLHFHVHDMRKVFRIEHFDYVLNLFTSFGYFDQWSENQQAIDAIADGLKSGGKLMLDFLNPYKVINDLVAEELKEVENISFRINKHFENDFIKKDIQFEHQGQSYHFQERVKAIRMIEFLEFFDKSNLNLLHIFGDYQLNSFDRATSDRMIFVVQKP